MTVKIVGLFGQSGAGKTSIIKSLPQEIDGNRIFPYTGIIRHLFQKNNNLREGKEKYISPERAYELGEFSSDMNSDEYFYKAQETFTSYIKSQMDLINDYSAEVFDARMKRRGSTNQYLLFDRTPFDFYAVTMCGIEWLTSKLGVEPSEDKIKILELIRKIAEQNTKNIFDVFVITYPWTDSTDGFMRDGIRDVYLNEEYTGDNYYSKLDDCTIENVETITIERNIIKLEDRTKVLSDAL